MNGGEANGTSFGNNKVADEKSITPPPSYDQIDVTFKDGENKSEKGKKKKGKKEKKEEEPQVGYFELFRYATNLDYVYLFLGTLAACIHGASMPVLFIFFGDLTTSFVAYGKYQPCNFNLTQCIALGVVPANTTQAEFDKILNDEIGGESLDASIERTAIIFSGLAVGVWIFGWFQVTFWVLQASRQLKKIRILFFQSILRQDIGFFDLNSTGELNTRLADDVSKIQEGINDKVSLALMNVVRFIAGLIIGMIYSWRVSLVILAVSPLLGISAGVLFKLVANFTKKELAAYAKAGSVAEEVLSSIRTVVAFGGQDRELERYSENLDHAKQVGIRKGFTGGLSIGVLMLVMFSMYGLAFWYGSTLVLNQTITVGNLLTAFFSVLIGAFSLGQAGSNVEYFASAKAAAFKIFQVIDRTPPIDSFSDEGHKPDRVEGKITFRDVNFFYPSRDDVQILHDVNLTAESGQTTAFCGQSGCGKSTCIQLVQRFYDPKSGTVELDGVDIRTLNVRWLRENIGVVAQEPILFDTTIAENIRYGRTEVTMDEIVDATKQANAYDFIMKLPKKFETMVGESGGQMSGGQKQRIAIARAIVRNPKIMLLDEATSALDTESESIVQAALDKASQGRTTIVIAHRLSTIKNSDQIIGFHEGRALESGSHEELLKVENGVYQNLVHMQSYEAHEGGGDDHGGEKKKEKETKSKRASERKRLMSDHANDDDSDSVDDEEEKIDDVGFGRVIAMNKPEIGYIILGCVAAGINGGLQPLFAILFAGILNAFALPPGTQQDNEIILYSLLFVAIGGAMFLANIIQSSCFAKSGEELTKRLRAACFHAMMRQEIGYFDDHRNSTGALTTRLATDASKVQGATGVRIGTVVQSILGMGVALGIAFAYSWELTLLTMAFVPFMAAAGVIEAKLLVGQTGSEVKSFEEAGQIATEATLNIRTVVSLTREKNFLDKYKQAMVVPYKKSAKKAQMYGFMFGFSQAIAFFAYAAAFRFGAWLATNGRIEFDNVFKVLMAVIFGAFSVGQASSFAPDYAQAKVSAARIFKLLDRVPSIDSYSQKGEKLDSVDGTINYSSIKFTYPTRPDIQVLKGLTAEILPGQTVALVGQSGCGKSTCIQLLERFYDPVEGSVQLDGKITTEFNISSLRSKFGIVSQEPVLFDRSIADNIRYGDNSRTASMDEVITAAKNANIHTFIESLPQKYETNAGSKGTQLSGGQKQRIAIARALLRNPKILLLDEATSALDTESERIVQDALDAASAGRTCIVIAHRLSTVKNADVILVIENGTVVESGNHQQLLALQGSYFSLVNAQLHSRDK